jgi:hypothetical protein
MNNELSFKCATLLTDLTQGFIARVTVVNRYSYAAPHYPVTGSSA